MYSSVHQQPVGFIRPELGPAPGSSEGVQGPVTVRQMRNEPDDLKFAADLSVEAFRSKYVHATSERSIPLLKECTRKDIVNQGPWYLCRNFIAEYCGQRAGLFTLQFKDDPKWRSGDSWNDLGCCDACGMTCLGCVISGSDISQGEAYLDHICVDEKFRGKGIGKVLLDRADYEAKTVGCSRITLYVSTRNRAKNLYERHGYRKTATESCCGILWCATGERGFYKMEKNLI